MGLRSFDATARPVDGLRNKSTSGGVITVMASGTALLLFLSQLFVYSRLETSQHFRMADSHTFDISAAAARRATVLKLRDGISIKVHVTFPYMKCVDLAVNIDGLGESEMPMKERLLRRSPNRPELKKLGLGTTSSMGCTLHGTLHVPRVGGSIGITVSQKAWMETTSIFRLMADLRAGTGSDMPPPRKMHNVTHYVHDIEFGTVFPIAPNPLHDTLNAFNNHFIGVSDESSGIGLCAVAVKLVHTKYKRFARSAKDTYQASVTQHMVQSQTLAAQNSHLLPGLNLVYDFTPFSVHHTEGRENLLTFLVSLVSIVAGVFVTVGMVSDVFLTAVNVGKKID